LHLHLSVCAAEPAAPNEPQCRQRPPLNATTSSPRSPPPSLSLPFAKPSRSQVRIPPVTATVHMGLREDEPSVAVVGVTGAVGQEFLRVFSDRDFPYRNIRLLASRRSAGKRLTFEDREYTVEELGPESFDGIDIALFSAGWSIGKELGLMAVERGSIVVDNSSAFRMDGPRGAACDPGGEPGGHCPYKATREIGEGGAHCES
ncbi:unnamed protein product, partial [Musa hybrid cultivar]